MVRLAVRARRIEACPHRAIWRDLSAEDEGALLRGELDIVAAPGEDGRRRRVANTGLGHDMAGKGDGLVRAAGGQEEGKRKYSEFAHFFLAHMTQFAV